MKKYFCDVCGAETETSGNAAGAAAELCGLEDLCARCHGLALGLDAAGLALAELRRLAGRHGTAAAHPPEEAVCAAAPAPSAPAGFTGRGAKEKREILAALEAYRKARGPGCLPELAKRARVREEELRTMLESGRVAYGKWQAVGRALGAAVREDGEADG